MYKPNSPFPDPATFPANHPYRVLGLPPEDDDPEGVIAWYRRMVAAYRDMLDDSHARVGELFLVIFEVPEAEQRYREILREKRSPEAIKAIIRQHVERKDAVAQLLRDTGLSG